MKSHIKAAWLEMLSDPQYSQCTLVLSADYNCFCATGILCELYRREHEEAVDWDAVKWSKYAASTPDKYNNLCYAFMGERHMIPQEVLDWAGLSSSQALSVSQRNDEGFTFPELATYIRRVF